MVRRPSPPSVGQDSKAILLKKYREQRIRPGIITRAWKAYHRAIRENRW